MPDARNGSSKLDKNLTTNRLYTRFPPLDPELRKNFKKQEEYEFQEEEATSTPEQRQEWMNLVELLRLNRRALLSRPGVTAVDLGYRMKNHEFLDELALRVHVERKLPSECFNDRKYDEIPKEITYKDKTYKLDVIEARYKLVQLTQPPRRGAVLETPQETADRRSRLDPLVGGISIGSPQVPAGTLGALVWDRVDGSVCILSNWHVLAGDLNAEPGHPCFQPALFDQGRSSDVVARLKRWCFNRHTDAAIAELTGSRHYCAGEIVSMFQQISGVTRPYLGMDVLKSGRSSGFTQGFIDGLYFSAAIEYSNGVVRVFEEQIHIAPLYATDRISEPGDSGSVWVVETNGKGYRAVGLHFAGDLPHSAFGEYALANPMTIVAERLNFSFRPLFLEVRDEDVISALPPPAPPATQIHVGLGAQPVSIVLGGLSGSGNQPVDNQMGGGGSTQPNPVP
jgi:endonuclease G, mitochondrial